MKTRIAALTFVGLAATLSTFADVPDLTDALEYLGNPAYSRWPSSALARHVQDLVPYQGKIFTSGGEWGKNLGPCPCFAVDPHSGGFVDEFDAGTDSIYEFKEFSDGRLHASAVDMHEGAANLGSSFRRETDGTWRAFYTGCGSCNITNFGSMAYEGYKIHSWDMAEFNGTVFLAGYGISASTNWCEKAMFDATPQLRDTIRYMGSVRYQSGGYSFYAPNYSVDRRFCAFLPFDDDIFCFPIQPAFNGDIQHFDSWEEWRWNASAKRFECQENSWSGVAPGLTAASASLVFPSNGVTDVQLWHPTKFGCRVLYILGDHTYNIRPWAAYSAVNENHHVRATKIDLGGDDVKPFDIFSDGAAAYIVAAEAGLEATMVTNSVWKSTDGLSFMKMFTFVSTRQASALCRYDGCFYLGMGSNDCTLKGWPKVKGTDVSGRIYRVRDPSVATTREVVAESAELSVAEGGNGVARFRLSARPDADFTAPVSLHSGTPAVTTSVRFVTFTTSDWNQWHEVPFVSPDDDDDATAFSSITCGAGSSATAWAATVKINVANNDVRVVETPPEGLVDLTSPEGDFESTGSAVTMAPFNDDTTLSSTSQRVCIQKTSFYITYKFAEPTVVDAYGIYNLKMNSYVERAPKAWTFRGSNDGTTWTPLDARRYETGWTAGEYRYYSFSNAVAFTQYRLDFTANNGNAYTQFAHLEFYRTGSGSSGGGDDPGGDQPGGGDEPEPSGGDGRGFARKTTFAPSASALAKIGDSSWTNFPVLVRLPASVSSQLRSAGGTDLLVKDKSGAELPFEVETFNPAGTTFVWVKVPALSSATVLTVHFGGAANTNNDPTAVWSRYAGVWHFAPSAAGTMAVPDATGNGLAGATTNELSSYEGPAGLGALQAGSVVRAPDYDGKLDSAAQFSASGWFKAPTQESSWWTVASKKVGITTGPNGENLWNVDKGWYLELPQSRTKLNLNYTTSAGMTVPDAAANWNYFQIVSDGSTLKVYLNGSSTPAVSKSYTVKASGTPYQMCRGGGCSREYRMRKGAASAAETALEYATMADESFFTMGEIETIGVFVPAPIFGGEGVPAPAFGVDQSSGNPVFTFAIGNAVKGAKYRIYKSESLTTPFEPYGDVIEAGDSGILNFVVPTADEPSCFFKIVAE